MSKIIFYLFVILFFTINCEDKLKIVQDRTCKMPIEKSLRWEIEPEAADEICCNNKGFAEPSGFWLNTPFVDEEANKTVKFYDSTTGKHLFTMPIGRTWQEFYEESDSHGWPSLRDAEANFENIIIQPGDGGEVTSIDGIHLGHNFPDEKGNRFCLDLVCIAGMSNDEEKFLNK